MNIIETRGLSKAFSGNYVLRNIDFAVKPAEVHCIVGENGAGKSTLIKLLSGALSPTSGEIYFDGMKISSMSPGQASCLGIQTIYQENILANSMTIAENISAGREPRTSFGLYDKKAARQRALSLMEEFDVCLDPDALVSRLSSAERQYVKILKSMALQGRVLIMDEPTSMFSSKDSDKVLEMVARIQKRGVAIIYISHHLQEIVRIADRITVLRDGEKVKEYTNGHEKIDLRQIASDMVGRPIDRFYRKRTHQLGDVAVQVRHLKLGKESPEINFHICSGEILGVAGMVGSGRTEMARAIFGADRRYSGDIVINNKTIGINRPRDSIAHDLAFITEDRQKQGLALEMHVLENLIQVNLSKYPGLWFSMKQFLTKAKPVYERVGIRGCGPLTQAKHLSGGNQQKVVLGKWLMVDSDFLIFDEPTRGIDVNAKSEIHSIMIDLAEAGKSILLISSDLPELIALSDRVLVMRKGSIAGELTGESISERNIINRALEVEQ